MKNIKYTEGGVCSAKGFKAGGIYCGIKKSVTPDGNESPFKGKNDLALIVSDTACNTAAVYTKNKVKGSPVTVTKNNLAKTGGKAQAVIANSGNANACTPDGDEKANAMCKLAADALGIEPELVIVASTGVIGQILPIIPIEKSIKPLADSLSYTGNEEAAAAIMTTDTIKKEAAVEFEINGKSCRLGGMAKGSGMINPNMATLLNFITTDVNISCEMLQRALDETVAVTLNCLSVDGDTSTNDMVTVMANGLAGNNEITCEGAELDIFGNALFTVMRDLTKMLAKDGEGATKLLECICRNAPDRKTALAVARSVINSPLFKSAMFGEDANCGRIMCAVGYADAEFDINKTDVSISSVYGSVSFAQKGIIIGFSEENAAKILSADELVISIDLNQGNSEATVWGCDLTYDYVKINGDYRS